MFSIQLEELTHDQFNSSEKLKIKKRSTDCVHLNEMKQLIFTISQKLAELCQITIIDHR